MTASHAHAGPGHIYGELFYDYLTSKEMGYDKPTFEGMIQSLVEAARDLENQLTPVEIGVGSAVVWGHF